MSASHVGHDMGFHVDGGRSCTLMQRAFLRRPGSRRINARDRQALRAGNRLREPLPPCGIGWPALVLRDDLVRDNHLARSKTGDKTSGNPKTDNAAPAARDGLIQRVSEALRSASADNGGSPSGDARLERHASYDNDARWIGKRAHMPNPTLRVLLIFMLRYRASAHSGKNFA